MTLLKTKEIASILRTSVPTVRRLIADGDLQAVNVGKQKRVESGELARYLRGRPTQAASE